MGNRTVFKMVDLSTAHISEETNAMLVAGLTADTSDFAYTAWLNNGFVMRVPDEQESALFKSPPAELIVVFRWCQSQGYDYILLDQDARIEPELPVFDW